MKVKYFIMAVLFTLMGTGWDGKVIINDHTVATLYF